MNRIPWDAYEAALLLQALMGVLDEKVPRTQAISETSRKLRQMAQNRNWKIDEKFRDEAGIHLKMMSLEAIFTKKSAKLSTAKWMYKICDIYANCPDCFEWLVQEANRMCYLSPDKKVAHTEEIPKIELTRLSPERCKSKMNHPEANENLVVYNRSKPDSVVYYGDKKSTASWRLLYFIALKLIAAKHPDELMRLERKSILGDRIEIGSEIEIREFSHPLGIMRKPDGKWLFAETDFNSQQILLRLKKLMEICKDPLDTMVIYFSTNQSQNVSLRTDKSDSPMIRKSLAEIFRPEISKVAPAVTSAEEQYVQWLIQKGEKPSEAQAAFSMTEKVINRLQISAKRLFSVTSAVELKYILSALRRTPQWRYFSSRQQNQIVHTIELYREFRESSGKALPNEQAASPTQQPATASTSHLSVSPAPVLSSSQEVSSPEKFSCAGTNPLEALFDGKHIETKTWKDVYVAGVKELYSRYPQKFISLIGDPDNKTGVYIETAYRAHKLKGLKVLTKNSAGQWLYLETEKTPDEAMTSLYKLLDHCGVAHTALSVQCMKADSDVPVTVTDASIPQVVSSAPAKPIAKPVAAPVEKTAVRTPPNANSSAFYQWMRNEMHLAESSSRSYASAINNCEQLARQIGLDSTTLYDVSLEVATRTKDLLTATKEYTATNARQNNRLRAALAKYMQYLSVPESTSTKKEPIASKPVATPMQAPAVISPVSQELIRDVEKVVLDTDLDGIALSDLYGEIHASDYSIREAVSASSKIASLAGKLYHEDAFVDWDDGASQMEQLLEKLMERNDGYVSDTQLYEYVRAEMQMFLNDNGISSSAMVYDLARHLFEKVGYHGKHYSFSNKTHISRVGNEQIGSVLDVMRRYAREQGGMFVEEDLVQYLQNVGLKTGNLHGQMKLNEEPIFLYYQPDVLITGESLQLNDAWFSKAQQALDKLFSDLGDHIVLRDIQPWWYSLLPALPGDRPWTPLLLQSILGFYSKKLGNAKTICGMASQSKDTLHAMLVSGSSEVQTFSDAVAAWYVDDGITGKRFQAEDLRELLVKRGLLAGSELYGRLHKALANDPRFAWSADNATVTINL